MEHEIPHHLPATRVRELLDRAVEHYAVRYAKYQPRLRWLDGDDAEVTLTALGVTLRGRLTLADEIIKVRASVPLALRPFAKKALAVVDRELGKWLAPVVASS